MKKNHPAFAFALFVLLAASASARDYGYRLWEGPNAVLWWAEGAYKVMKDDPVPSSSADAVSLACARNEYEPFLLVLRPNIRMNAIRVQVSDLNGPAGAALPAAAISIRHVEYVQVEIPTDAGGKEGWWPDPLPPYQGPFAAPAGENHPLWITVFVPTDAAPGEYAGTITLSSGSWRSAVPLRLKVRNFALPGRPSLRSSFGLPSSFVKRYHNLETNEEVKKVMDLYFQDLKEHRLAPTSPFELYPIETVFSGIPWEGGEFTAGSVHGGKRALTIVDEEPNENVDARTRDMIPVEPGVPYALSWWIKGEVPDREYSVLLEAADAEGGLRPERNVLGIFKGTTDWKEEKLEIKEFGPGVASIRVRLFPAFRDELGTTTGTATFDDIVLAKADSPLDLLSGGDFETPAEAMSVTADFREFDGAARRYLDEFGFNAFNLALEGLGSGSFFDRREGLFGGFRQGTAEYDRLLSQYLGQVEAHLAANGWLGKEYIYWFDEPDPKDYPFVREGMSNIRKNAPRLTRFITEHRPGPEIMDVTEIGCTIFDRVDPEIVASLAPKGREFWSYLCTGPKSPWVTLFIDHPEVNLRMWPWMSYRWGLKGILVWEAIYWNSSSLFSLEAPQNPWTDPMSYTVGYGIPYGQPRHWGNGDGRFLYPPRRAAAGDKIKDFSGPIDSVRWEILREGLEDYEYFVLLEKAARSAPRKRRAAAREAFALLAFPDTIFSSGKDYTKDPLVILRHREKIASAIEGLLKK